MDPSENQLPCFQSEWLVNCSLIQISVTDLKAIIGAGAAGLICARECILEGFGVEIFERSKHPGGTWVLDQVPSYLQEMNGEVHKTQKMKFGFCLVYHDGYDEMTKTVHSSMYENLRTNIARHIMGVSYYPFDDQFHGSQDPRCFPSRAEVNSESNQKYSSLLHRY